MTIKQQIIDRVNAIEDPTFLKGILDLINAGSELEEVYSFTQEEKRAVQEGLQDIDAGRVYSNEAAKKLISKWLEERSGGL